MTTRMPHIIGVFLGLVVISPATWLITYDAIVPVATVKSQTPINPLVKAGSELLMKFDIDRARSCPVKLEQWIFDGRGVQYAIEPTYVPARLIDLDTVIVKVPVPTEAAPGRARYQMSFTHTCDVIDSWYRGIHTVTLPYVQFVIEPEDQPAQPQIQETK